MILLIPHPPPMILSLLYIYSKHEQAPHPFSPPSFQSLHLSKYSSVTSSLLYLPSVPLPCFNLLYLVSPKIYNYRHGSGIPNSNSRGKTPGH
jgi:hypothetical protein